MTNNQHYNTHEKRLDTVLGPKAVRIGQSTFAVHNEELATVEVRIEE